MMFFLKYYLIGIRHPEELSFAFPLGQEHLKQNFGQLLRSRRNGYASHHGYHHGDDRDLSYGGRGRSPLPPPDTNTFIASTTSNGMYSRHNQSTGSNSSGGSGGGERFLCAPVRSPSSKTPNTSSSPMSWTSSNNGASSPYNTLGNGNTTSYSPIPLSASSNGFNELDLEALATTPLTVDPNLKHLRPRNLVERARLNVA